MKRAKGSESKVPMVELILAAAVLAALVLAGLFFLAGVPEPARPSQKAAAQPLRPREQPQQDVPAAPGRTHHEQFLRHQAEALLQAREQQARQAAAPQQMPAPPPSRPPAAELVRSASVPTFADAQPMDAPQLLAIGTAIDAASAAAGARLGAVAGAVTGSVQIEAVGRFLCVFTAQGQPGVALRGVGPTAAQACARAAESPVVAAPGVPAYETPGRASP